MGKMIRVLVAAGVFVLVAASGFITMAPPTTYLPIAVGSALVIFHDGLTTEEIKTAVEDLLSDKIVNFTNNVAVSTVQGTPPPPPAVTPGMLIPSLIVTPQNVASMTSADGTITNNAPIGSTVVNLGNGWYQVTTPTGEVVNTKINPLTS